MMNLPTKWVLNPLFANKLGKFAGKTLFHGQNALFLKYDIFPRGLS